jgi:hypothetical protein
LGGGFRQLGRRPAHPAQRNEPAAGRARSERGAVRMRAPATGRPSPSSPSSRLRDGACLSPGLWSPTVGGLLGPLHATAGLSPHST